MLRPSPKQHAWTGRPPKLLDRVRDVLRRKHYSYSTEQAYVYWNKRFILFHNKRHPRDLSAAEIEAFLTHLAVKENVAASTQNQALSALLFLNRDVLGQEKAVRQAAKLAGINRRVTPHTFRLSFTTHLCRGETLRPYDIRTVQKLLGHKDVKTTMIYTRVMNKGAYAVRSPLDG
jgi:site-specific recombinase XerD